jgi:hypothetical protein
MVADHQGGWHHGRMKLAGDRATSALDAVDGSSPGT